MDIRIDDFGNRLKMPILRKDGLIPSRRNGIWEWVREDTVASALREMRIVLGRCW